MSTDGPDCGDADPFGLRFEASLLDYAQQAIIVTALDGAIVYWNRYASTLYGWQAAEAIGRPIVEVIVTEDASAHAQEILAALRAGESWQGEFEVRRKDGSEFICHVFDAPLVDESGQLVGIIGISEDVTERVLAERSNQQLRERLIEAQAQEAVGRLATGIAHDINNLLTGIMTHASLIREQAPPPGSDYAATIHQLGARAGALLRDLLDFAGSGRLKVERVNMRELVGETCGLLRRALTTELRLREDFAPGPLFCRGDPVQLGSLVMNLCTNAVDALDEGGELCVRLTRERLERGDLEGDHLRLEVIDDGVGMDEATRARALEPFFTTKQPGKGTGLGLGMALDIAQRHGGRLEIDSRVGEGTRVSVWIPSVARPAERAELEERPASNPARGARILLIEDEPIVRAGGELVLEQLGCAVMSASEGRHGLSLFREHGPDLDLVILDLEMPELSGVETFHALRRVDPEVPILLATGRDGEQVSGLLAAGACGLLRKPYDTAELRAAVQRALARDEP